MHILSCKYTSLLFALHRWCWCVLFKDIYLYCMSALESQSTLEKSHITLWILNMYIYSGIYAYIYMHIIGIFLYYGCKQVRLCFLWKHLWKCMLGVNYLHLTLLLYTYSHECPLACIIEKFVLEETGIKELPFSSTSQHNRAQHIHRQFSWNRQHVVEQIQRKHVCLIERRKWTVDFSCKTGAVEGE